jgi:Xaa-Pro aminopeptidase
MMRARGIDGLVSTFRPNVYYLSTFAGNLSMDDLNGGGAVVISSHAPDNPVLLVPSLYVPWVTSQPTWIEDIRGYGTFSQLDIDKHWGTEAHSSDSLSRSDWGANAIAHHSPGLGDAVQQAMRDLGLARGRVAFDVLRSAALAADLEVEVIDGYGPLKFVRQVKTTEELALLRTAATINQLAVEETVRGWQPGMTFHQINHMYNSSVADLGGFVQDPNGMAVMSPEHQDPRIAFCMQTGFEEDFVVQPGTNIIFDCHGKYQRYAWDGGKTWVVDDEIKGLDRIIATGCGEAMLEINQAMRPGRRISELQAIGRRVLRKHGLSRAEETLFFFHGLGLDHNDLEIPPGSERQVADRLDWAVEADNVICPHIAYPGDESDRYWIEDITHVTPEGGRPLFSWGIEPLLNAK